MKVNTRFLACALVMATSLLFAASVSAQERFRIPVRGLGCWVQENAAGNPHIHSDAFSWYAMGITLIDEFHAKSKRPIIFAFSGRRVEALKEHVDRFRGKIVGVIWDYEFKTSRAEADAELRAAHRYCHEKGLPFGVVVLADPANSLRTNGVDYRRAHEFSDFLLPMLYSQWWKNQPGKTRSNHSLERAEASVPTLPLLTLKTTMTKPPLRLTPRDIEENYGDLRLETLGVWNVKDLTPDQLNALRRVVR